MKKYSFIFISVLLMSVVSCKKEPTIPIVKTYGHWATSTEICCGGEVTDDGGGTITDRGVCWSNTPDPYVNNLNCYPCGQTNEGAGTGEFNSYITGLTPNTSYYYRAYAKNSAGIGYGNQGSFTTPN